MNELDRTNIRWIDYNFQLKSSSWYMQNECYECKRDFNFAFNVNFATTTTTKKGNKINT